MLAVSEYPLQGVLFHNVHGLADEYSHRRKACAIYYIMTIASVNKRAYQIKYIL